MRSGSHLPPPKRVHTPRCDVCAVMPTYHPLNACAHHGVAYAQWCSLTTPQNKCAHHGVTFCAVVLTYHPSFTTPQNACAHHGVTFARPYSLTARQTRALTTVWRLRSGTHLPPPKRVHTPRCDVCAVMPTYHPPNACAHHGVPFAQRCSLTTPQTRAHTTV